MPAHEHPAPAVNGELQPASGPTSDQSTELPPVRPGIAVPATLRNLHPAVAQLRDAKGRLDITPSSRNRALRVLQALALAAGREGYRVEVVKPQRSGYGRVWYDTKDHLVIDTGETREGVRIFQQTDRALHEPTPRERDEQKRWGTRPPKYDHAPNDKLRIELDTRWDGRQHSWSEGPRGPIEAKLPAILEEIDYRQERARQRRVEAEHAAAERERQRLMARTRAEKRARHAYRAEILQKQAADWREAQLLREYIAAMAAQVDDDPQALLWIAWARSYVETLDPLNGPLEPPKDPDWTEERLRPFMS